MDNLTQDLSAGPQPAYRALVASGGLVPDTAQAAAAARLQALWAVLRGYDPQPRRPATGLLARLRRRPPPRRRRAASTWSARSAAASPC